MNSPRYRKESAYVDHSAIYFENERLADRMRKQIDSLCKDKHRAFLSRQAKITSVMGNLDKLQAFQQAVSNTAAFRLTATLNNNCSMPKGNHSNEISAHRDTNKKYPCSDSSPVGTNDVRNSGEIHQPFNKSCSSPVLSEKISCVVQNDLINRRLSSKKKTRSVKTAWDMEDLTEQHSRVSPYDDLRQSSKSVIQGIGFERQRSAPLFKTSSKFSSPMQGNSRVLNERPSSCKEQWAGLAEGLTCKRNSSAGANWSRFRPAGSTRICTVGYSRGFIEALTMRRLREIYTLEEPGVGMMGFRKAESIQHLSLVNQEQNQRLQEKVKNFLEEISEKNSQRCSDHLQ